MSTLSSWGPQFALGLGSQMWDKGPDLLRLDSSWCPWKWAARIFSLLVSPLARLPSSYSQMVPPRWLSYPIFLSAFSPGFGLRSPRSQSDKVLCTGGANA